MHPTPARSLLALLPLLAAGCATTAEPVDWTAYEGPGKHHFLKEEIELPVIPDPLEPMNRVFAGFNHGLMVAIIAPIGWVYRNTLPKPVRNGIGNVFDNLYYPVRLVGNLTQGKLSESWTETKRFAVNSTVGVLGIRDQATRWGMEASREDLGQSFGTWGWDESSYLVLPVLGPSTVRDGIGGLGDAVVDPLSYFFPATQVRAVTKLSEYVPAYKSFVKTNFDPYQTGRTLFVLSRNLKIDDYRYEEVADDSGAADTLEAVFLAHDDPDFPGKARSKTIDVGDDHEVAFSLWLQDDTAPLVYFIPGTGGHREGGSTLALCEVGYENGNSVVALPNSMNFEFIDETATAALPGFVPADARDMHRAIDAIDRHLEKRYPGRFTNRRLVGLSLGGLTTLHIAAAEEDPANDLMRFDAYLALNSPVSYGHAVEQVDAFYNAPLIFPPEERDARISAILRKVLDLAEGTLEPTERLPFDQLESRFLIGLSFRKTLSDVIYQTQDRWDQGVLLNKPSFWRRSLSRQEISTFSFMEYLYAFALPYFAERRVDITYSELGAQKLLELCSLPAIADALRDNERVGFVTNLNDFLLRRGDVDYLERLFGDRLLLFDRGGHIGNLYKDDIREAITGYMTRTLLQE
jgi:ABC-type transporter lipoprotein component MlaA